MGFHGPSPRAKIVNTAQYRLKQGLQELWPNIEDLQKGRAIIPSPFPLFAQFGQCSNLVKNEWYLTVDYYNLNAVVPAIQRLVLNIIEISDSANQQLENILLFLHLAHMFYYVSISTACWPQFAFTFDGIQYTFTWLSMGYLSSFALPQSLQTRSSSQPPSSRNTGVILHRRHPLLLRLIWHIHSRHTNTNKGAHQKGCLIALQKVPQLNS